MKFYVIPNLNEIDKWNELALKLDLGYEYNDFFTPCLLDDQERLNNIIKNYEVLGRNNDTLHGVFFDINFASVDSKIKDISIKRAKTSLDIASKLNCKAVIFHTNYQTWIKNNNYKISWIENSKAVYKELLDEFPNIDIYVENMFDDDPYLLKELASSLKEENLDKLKAKMEALEAFPGEPGARLIFHVETLNSKHTLLLSEKEILYSSDFLYWLKKEFMASNVWVSGKK